MPLQKAGKQIPDVSKATERFKKTLPVIIANNSKNHYLEGFRRGGKMTDKSRGGWKSRKKADKIATRRAILVKSGQLRDDLDVRKTTFEEIILGTQDIIYASVHNEGQQSGRGAGFTMPQREFLGQSSALDMKNNKLILRHLNKMYKER